MERGALHSMAETFADIDSHTNTSEAIRKNTCARAAMRFLALQVPFSGWMPSDRKLIITPVAISAEYER